MKNNDTDDTKTTNAKQGDKELSGNTFGAGSGSRKSGETGQKTPASRGSGGEKQPAKRSGKNRD